MQGKVIPVLNATKTHLKEFYNHISSLIYKASVPGKKLNGTEMKIT